MAIAAASGCAGDTGDLTREEFCERWATRACSEEVVSACQAEDAQACEATQTDVCLEMFPADRFAGQDAQTCLASVEGAYADADLTADELETISRLGTPCDNLVVGPMNEDEACSEDRDCDTASGFACVFRPDEEMGTCQVPLLVDPGFECTTANSTCSDGFYCNGDNCVADLDPGDDCATDYVCGQNGYCGDADTCVEPLAVNEPCERDAQCASGICFSFSDDERVCTDRVRLSRSEPLCDEFR